MVEKRDDGLDEDVPPEHATGWTRLAERYVAIRATTIARDGGPSRLLQAAVRAPVGATVVLVLGLGGIVGFTFGVPPLSPLFLVALLSAPAYPWLRLEARAVDTWRSRDGHAGS